MTDKELEVGQGAKAGTLGIFDNLPTDDLGMMTLEALATLFGVDQKTIRNWVARREIPFIRHNRHLMFNRNSVREWLLRKESRPRGYR